jgi:hypothetical protein
MKRIFKLSFIILIIFITICTFSISTLMNSTNPKVFFVYTQNDGIPDIAFQLSAVPLAIASLIKHGEVVFTAIPATSRSLKKGFDVASFMIVGTHGSDGLISVEDGPSIGPDDFININMKHIYFGACEARKKQVNWEKKFPNAKIISFSEVTTPFVGWKYLVFESWIDLFYLL